MTRNSRCLTILVLLLTCVAALAPAQEKRPNILFLFADDQRPDTIAALGNEHIITPNLDRLANEGTAFTRNYCMGSFSGAVCAPSRYMTLTGRSLWRVQGNVFNMQTDEPLLPEVLRKAGYATFGTGKWHNGRQWFHRSFTHGGSIFFGGMGSHTELKVFDFDPTGTYPNEKRRKLRDFSSTEFANATIDFLKSAPKDRPFFAYCSFTAPHDPRTPPKKYRDMYDAAKLPLPADYLPEHPFNNGDMILRDERLATWPRTPEIVREHLAEYYGMITQMDAQIGRVLEALEKTGRADDTIVVFAADHGLAVGSHGLLGKQNMYEHSMGCPLILSGPDIPEGETNEGFTYLLDLFPTLCEFASVDVPDTVEGRSLVPVLWGHTKSVRNEVYLAYRDIQRALVTDHFKLIRYPRIDRTQLFDLRADPHETKDLAGDAKHAKTIKALSDRLKSWQRELADPHPWDNPNRQPEKIPLPPRKKTPIKKLLPKHHEIEPRTGLGNSLRRLRQGEARIAYLGGSITQNPGWRDQTSRWIRSRFPEARLDFVNAGTASTDSTAGACRLARDVLDGGPVDLLFVEFAVNDPTNGKRPEEQARGMEGIVRQARSRCPEIDIVFLHCADPAKLRAWRSGRPPEVVAVQERVAAHYGIPSVDLSRELARRIAAGEVSWKEDIRNLHPSPYGQRLYAASIRALLEEAWSGKAEPRGVTPLPRPLDPRCYDRGTLVPPAAARLGAGWTRDDAWRPSDGAATRPGFAGVPFAVAETPGAELELDFEGTAIGLFVTSGPDAGAVEWSVDGGPWRTRELRTRWSRHLHLPWTVMLAAELDDGPHRLALRTRRAAKDGGSAVRIAHFLVNGGVVRSRSRIHHPDTATPAPREPAVPARVFADLFDGKTLDGWVNVNCAASTWKVRDGMIVCSGKPTGVLRTDRMYENFILELEWRHMRPKGNAGLFLWSDPVTARGQPFTRSIEVQILDGRNTRTYTSHGDVFAIHGARMTPDRPHPTGAMRCLPSERRSKPAGQWNHYRVTCREGTVKLEVNGKEVSGGHDISPRKGYICLESEGSEIHFRNLRIHELPPSARPLAAEDVADPDEGFVSLYDGESLAGWANAEPQAEHWRARDWRLDHDGRGETLWTGKRYRDFVLIVDWRWTGRPRPSQAPEINADGTYAVDARGRRRMVDIAHSGDSGILLRGSEKAQVNIWDWPIGSGEVWGYRTDPALPAAVRAAATPSARADAPHGRWNRFVITMRGERLTVELNGRRVVNEAHLAGIPAEGPIGLQHHGSRIQFANIYVREL